MIETIDGLLATGLRFLTFTPALERRFKADNWAERSRYLVRNSIVSIVLYDCYLLVDWFLIPDVFREACIRRLGIFTPVALLALFIGTKIKSGIFDDYIFILIAILSFYLPTSLINVSISHYVVNYSYGTILIMINFSVNQRNRLYHSAVINGIIIAILIVNMVYCKAYDGLMMQVGIATMTSAGVMLLAFAYVLEREQRLAFLLALRGRLLTRQLDLRTRVDSLTGLWNRRHLNQVMHEAWSASQGCPIPMAVILVDVDNFKSYNDTYGHLEGDRCLQQVGRCLFEALEDPRGALVRFGGEEFLVFLPGSTLARGVEVAERLRQSIHRPIAQLSPSPTIGVTISCGVTAGNSAIVTPAALIEKADGALYAAKAAGRDCVRPVLVPLPGGAGGRTMDRRAATAR